MTRGRQLALRGVMTARSARAVAAVATVASLALASGCTATPTHEATPSAGVTSGAASTLPSGSPEPTGNGEPSTTLNADHSVQIPPAAQHSNFVVKRLAPRQRPPQFVIVGFDGSGDVAQLRQWGRITRAVRSNVTYFLSGVFMLNPEAAQRYRPPHEPRGLSEVGFAKPQDPVSVVTRLLSRAWLEGNDIGTHFNGHFCGPGGVDTWRARDWLRELRQFDRFVNHWKTYDNIHHAPHTSYNASVSVGARTPCLEGRPQAYLSAMKQLGYRYDTSATGLLEWPTRTLHRLWEFPLQTIRWEGHKRGSMLAMDYNFWFHLNGGRPIVGDRRRKQVSNGIYRSYLAAFHATYHSNRAPLFFGNHMNYWGCNRAYRTCDAKGGRRHPTPLQHFGPFVDGLQRAYVEMCTKPHVQCISYREMADWLDAQRPSVLRALQARPAVNG